MQYGNPVRIYTDDGHEYICLTIELYERMFGAALLPDGLKTGNGDETE